MHIRLTDRGFAVLEQPDYPGAVTRLVPQASLMGDDDDAWEKPGSSCLWIGKDHHLSRADVRALLTYCQRWLATGHRPAPDEARP